MACLVLSASAFAQGKVKVVEKKFENGKPEIVKYFVGQKKDEYLSKREVYNIDGKLLREEEYANGKLHGKVKQWKAFNGMPELELNYIAGELEGEQKYFFSDGKVKRLFNYKGGRMDGKQIEYWFKKSDDTLKVEHNYSGGVLHGMQRKWDKDGQLVYNYHFVAGKPDGIQRYQKAGDEVNEKWTMGRYDEVLEAWTAAQPRHVRMYEYESAGDTLDLKLGKNFQKELHYFESGAIQALTEGTDKPETTEYHPNGKERAKGAGTLKKPVGKWRYFHLDGTKAMDGEYVDGRKHGLWVSWDTRGNIISEEIWNKETGKRDSWQVSFFHQNGEKESEGALDAEGFKKGMWKYWYPNGNKKREETWEMSCEKGTGRPFSVELKLWDETEKLIAEGNENDMKEYEYYKGGSTKGVHSVIYPNRQPCMTGPVYRYKDGRIEVEKRPGNYDEKIVLESIWFYESGDSMRVDRWDEKGERHGYQEGWYETGKKKYYFHYNNGGVQGTVREWYPDGSPMIDHKYKSAQGGPPKLVEGTYWNEKGKDYFFSDSSGKTKKKAMVEIDGVCYFWRFIEEIKE
jgi:antitoxin component YwqK of YwqJK toxin-antitoxin module